MSVSINTSISLSEPEQAICRYLAKKRYESSRQAGVINRKIGNQSNEETDLEGIGAEFAFCKLFNVFPDCSVCLKSSVNGNDDGDAVLCCGKTVDVKTTKYATGRLIVVPWKKAKVDLFALMIGTFPSYTFKGFMKSDELINDKKLGKLVDKTTYIAEQKELKTLEEIENEETTTSR